MGRENRPNNRRNPNDQLLIIAKRLKDKFSNSDFSLSSYSMEELIKDSEDFGKELANNRNFKMTQLRKFHSHFTKIWTFLSSKPSKEDTFEEIKPQIQFSKVYLAYQAARNRNNNSYSEFEKIISTLIDKVEDYKGFEKLKRFIDALVAYHKYYGGN